VTEPSVVLLDESAGGLTEPEVHRLLPTIVALRTSGVAVIWIEHVVHALLAVADRLLCIAHGKELISGPPQEVMSSPAVEEIYLGTMDT
jgi:branched-chain amino acid transport system ATP-binding protein